MLKSKYYGAVDMSSLFIAVFKDRVTYSSDQNLAAVYKIYSDLENYLTLKPCVLICSISFSKKLMYNFLKRKEGAKEIMGSS